MDDLVSKMQQILGSEEGMQKLKNVAEMLGMGEQAASEPSSNGEAVQEKDSANAMSALLAGLGSDSGGHGASTPDLGGLDLNLILTLQQAMSAFHNEDDNTRFLQALRPLMREGRRHKVDEVLRMMKLFSLIPLLKESGILEKII